MSMVFKTGFREVMRLDSSGNLGIGTRDYYGEIVEMMRQWPKGTPKYREAVNRLWKYDAWVADPITHMLHMHDVSGVPHDDNTYRVSVFPDGVDIVCFGLESVDSQLEGHYDRIDDLPDWVKERLAVLNMMSPSPPTNSVDGVGRRISAHVYWVFAPSASTSA